MAWPEDGLWREGSSEYTKQSIVECRQEANIQLGGWAGDQ